MIHHRKASLSEQQTDLSLHSFPSPSSYALLIQLIIQAWVELVDLCHEQDNHQLHEYE